MWLYVDQRIHSPVNSIVNNSPCVHYSNSVYIKVSLGQPGEFSKNSSAIFNSAVCLYSIEVVVLCLVSGVNILKLVMAIVFVRYGNEYFLNSICYLIYTNSCFRSFPLCMINASVSM